MRTDEEDPSEEIHRRVARDSDGKTYLWIVSHQSDGYHVCVWLLADEDVASVAAWDQMMSLRRSFGLPELAAPDNLSHPEPDKMTVRDLEDARGFLAGERRSALAWHAQEFFHQIDPSRFDCASGGARGT